MEEDQGHDEIRKTPFGLHEFPLSSHIWFSGQSIKIKDRKSQSLRVTKVYQWRTTGFQVLFKTCRDILEHTSVLP